MRRIRDSSFEEYVRWYLTRERRKRNKPADLSGLSDAVLLKEMRQFHPAKLRRWFERARWTIVSLDSVEESRTVVCVDSWETRRNGLVRDSGLNDRLAGALVAAAREVHYFDDVPKMSSNSVERHFRSERIEAFRRNWPELAGNERLVLCTMNADERGQNPAGTYYLHDGFGRLLAYLYAATYEGRPYRPMESFLAEEN